MCVLVHVDVYIHVTAVCSVNACDVKQCFGNYMQIVHVITLVHVYTCPCTWSMFIHSVSLHKITHCQ